MANTDTIRNYIRGLIDDELKSDGRDTYQYESDNRFTLSEPFVDSNTISVFKNGTLLTSGVDYTYDSTNNQIVISASLTLNDIILITYSYYAKYSDSEILNYIESALCYFVQYRYKKVFTIDEDYNVVANPGVNPTTAELQFIAIICALLIEPSNVQISTKEFNVKAKEFKSRSDLIAEAFRQFLRNFGKIDFLEYEETNGCS